MTTLTQRMSEKVEMARELAGYEVDRAAKRGDEATVQAAARHYWRLRRAEEYLEERDAR